MRNGMLDKGVNLCVSSARDLVELITGNLDLCNEVLPPSWHNVFCTWHTIMYTHLLTNGI